jgi:hypothetical protein
MERSSNDSNLVTALAEARPAPREDFAKELDQRVAAGFPRRSRLSGTPLGGFAERIGALTPQRLVLTGGAIALATIAIATVLVAGNDSRRTPVALDRAPQQSTGGEVLSQVNRFSRPAEPTLEAEPESAGSARAADSAGAEHSAGGLAAGSARLGSYHRRDIERSAEIGLHADPGDVASDSAAVFAAVHDAHGIVLHSTTTAGKHASADFDLLIPSARLGDALAAFSAVDEVRTRHEATDDITAPTVATSERLRDSRARIDSLLTQLSSAETEAEMATIEAELARERHHAAYLQGQLDKLEQRTSFSRVSVKIETDGSTTGVGGTWGIGDAFHDAGHILDIAVAVTLVGLAVLAPLALLCLLAWLAHHVWVRTQRRRALTDA